MRPGANSRPGSMVMTMPGRSGVSSPGRFDGHSVSCVFSNDRDCLVPGVEHDLARFAWTWSGTDWAFYLKRFGNSGGWEWY